MTPLAKYLAYPPHPQTAGDIILWWESRRLIYNGIIFAAILVSALLLAAVMQPKRLADYLSRVGTLVATAFSVLQIPANVWYTGGWVADLVVKRVLRLPAAGFGPWALADGTAFSLLFIGLLVTVVFAARNSNRDNRSPLAPLLTPFGARGPSRFMKAFLALAMTLFFGFQFVMGILT
jgi:preprotein translocase subunit SecG